MEQKSKKIRKLEGVVISDKMAKTRVVAVNRLKKHPKYQKYFRVTSRFKTHDENNEYKTGDKVLIEQTRPLSKEKRWRIIGKI
ncbi:MAG: 30S ribosomal protein S17 [Candidatus Liptonbacteria bacterium]|nr:30S ribosomal protein S17 [Candidatus Liptonbacteria bacterium]